MTNKQRVKAFLENEWDLLPYKLELPKSCKVQPHKLKYVNQLKGGFAYAPLEQSRLWMFESLDDLHTFIELEIF